MIESIRVAGFASFNREGQTLDGLTRHNFIFGANGTGKTSISRVIANPEAHPGCEITWASPSRLECLVYNRDFVKKHFDQSEDLPGIFTLGEESMDILQRMRRTKDEIDQIGAEIGKLTRTLNGDDTSGGKLGELRKLDSDFRERCWEAKGRLEDRLQEAFKGVLDSKVKFMGRVKEQLANNSSELLALEVLLQKAETVFGANPSHEARLPVPDFTALVSHESDPILGKTVVGRSDVDLADMIDRLGNSDWVKRGLTYVSEGAEACPFCQQDLAEDFEDRLSQYFDESFERDSQEITRLRRSYHSDAESVLETISQVEGSSSRFLAHESMEASVRTLRATIESNLQRLETKSSEPSRKIELDPLDPVCSELVEVVREANERIRTHNATVTNLAQERESLIGEVWRYFLDMELGEEVTRHNTDRSGLEKAVSSLNKRVDAERRKHQAKVRELRALERESTSVQPTVDAINEVLVSFGFHSFTLERVKGSPSYRLKRPDGTDARMTLSEGEKSFVTFLYFLHRLQGSISETGAVQDRVVVFDDPVSSLDNDILFVVSTLIGQLSDEVAAGTSDVKQVFVLTHNVYFHRQVTFRNETRPGNPSYWMVRKREEGSHITKYDSNPVRSSYELLWAELADRRRGNFAVQNSMRRILEHYFTHLGGISLADLPMEFEGNDRVICNSLVSWMHAGSHSSDDDVFIHVEDTTVDAFLRVFREIFEKTEHLPHYHMMMTKTAPPSSPGAASLPDGTAPEA